MDDCATLRPQQACCNRVFFTAVFAACLNGISVGFLAGWPQAAIPQLLSSSYTLTESQASWVSGILYLGMLVGGVTSIVIVGRFGKKRLFLLASVPLILGWSIVAIAASFWQFVFGRIILGIGGGMITHQTEMYLSEISPRRLRSNMSVMFCANVHVGILLSFTIGPTLTISSATGIYITLVLMYATLFLTIAPETPFWLIRQGRTDEGLTNLRKLRNRPDVHDEFDSIVEFTKMSLVAKKTDGAWQNFTRVFADRASRRAILLVVLLTTGQQFSGMGAMSSYAQLIFERSVSVIPGRYVSLLIGLIELTCTLISGFLIERLGRRPLITGSSTVCAGCMGLMGLYYHGLVGGGPNAGGVLPLVCIIVFALAYGLGLASIATVVAAECLSMDARNIGAAAQNTTLCFSVLLITKLWQVITSSYGQEYAFWLVSVITAGHTIVLLIMLPETRGRSLTEIQRLLASSSSPSAPSPHKSKLLVPHLGLQNIKIVPADGSTSQS
ncbi:facilitated trehalose transporter Tret1 [Nasonia vitripennis]|uniref:Major facilitator superfamily (MFS) profile domain-containing protein n=1 Tax=Nasonia vitripennis TaxID=7425 RepID=A0A7M7LJM2_NASVI|nr:facilitated trehalose transporter Tret1 [Nasonia vitripennis]